uniref:Pentatricopeptide repeat protein n=1 Tax=Salvia miltiorrhiza TaxID=226208 RepID=A0A678WDZ9_SALMI|nr:pentatricopeptide repeat protein [Salvia miltiorrhiza]
MPDSEKNVITWTNMITGFARNGLVDEARVAFDRMPLKNVVAWTSMIKAYVETDRVDEAFALFRVMPEHNPYAWNIMISGLLNKNRVDEANELFDSMLWRNAISWTIMVTGLARNGMTELARKYFDQMLNKDVPAWNAMITAYADEGRMVEAGELFNMMSKRDIITWNTMIGGYSMGRHEDEAFRHFDLMLQSGIRPNESSVTNLLSSCGGIMGVLQAHGLIARLGFEMLTSVANALITMYHRSGDVISARIAFQNLDAKDVVTWTAIILAYSNHGYGIEALQAFAQMLRLGHNPDEVTFVGVLSACSHAGFVKKGRMLFDSIKRGYGIEPTAEHYSCLVDILGRAGLVKEAVEVVDEMPRDKCDGAVLGALIGACRLLGADRVADHIGDELIELEPASSGGYVLLANLYAASGKWDKVSQLRRKMKEREVRKVPGFSQIEVNGKTHVFLVGDRAHPQLKEIYKFLNEKLIPEMKSLR